MKKILWVDIFREIKHTLGRFISITLLIAIGVLAFTGLQITGPDMLKTTAEYLHKYKAADTVIQSTYGLDKTDVDIIKKLDNIADYEMGYQLDTFIKGGQEIVRLHSLNQKLSIPEVKEGRLPGKSDEIALDYIQQKDEYKIGDMISFVTSNNKPETEHLKESTFKVVGFIQSPEYLIDGVRGTSQIGSGQVQAFAMINKDVFLDEYFSSAFLAFSNTEQLMPYTKKYEDTVDEEVKKVEQAFHAQPQRRLQKIKKDAMVEINEASDKLQQGENQLKQAEQQLQDTEVTLNKSELDYNAGLATFNNEMEKAIEMIDAVASALHEGKVSLDTAKSILNEKNGQVALEKTKLDAANKLLTENEQKVSAAKKQVETGIQQIDNGIQAIDTEMEQLVNQLPELQQKEQALDIVLLELQTQIATIEQQIKDLEEAGQEVPEDLKQQLLMLQAQYKKAQNSYAELQEIIIEIESDFPTLRAKKAALQQQKLNLNKELERLKDAEHELSKKRIDWQKGREMIEQAENKIVSARHALSVKEQEYHAGVEQFRHEQQLFEEEKEKGASKLSQSRVMLDTGWAQFYQAKSNFEEQRTKFRRELTNGKKDIAQAKADLNELKTPIYIIEGLSDGQSYTTIAESTTGLDVMGVIFPIFVFFVATLVCLTTMMRMVEEQRMQIGTLKQLGYSNADVRKKYVFYAFAAGTLGVLIGTFFGHVMIPKAIFSAYQTMLGFAKFKLFFSWSNTAISFVIAYLCTIGAALFTTGKLLKYNTATLLRGPAPANGSRILLERVTFIWKRLSFKFKVTFRNLFRYKQRMFMTIVGVAGCTALILMGLSLRSSIADLEPVQFEDINRFDVMVMFDQSASGYDVLQKTIEEDGNVKLATKLNSTSYTTKKSGIPLQDMQVIVPDDTGTFLQMNNLRNRKTKKAVDLGQEQVIVTEKIMSVFKKKIGEPFTLTNLEKETFEVTPRAIVEEYTQNKIYMTKDMYRQTFHKDYEPNAYMIQLKENSKVNEEKFVEAFKDNQAVTMVVKTSTFKEQIENMLGSLNSVIFIIIALSCLLATVVLYNLTNINVEERMRELSTIKVLGFYDIEVTMYIFRETAILTAIGILLGFIPGKLLHNYICYALPQGGTMFPLHISAINLVFTTLFVMLVSIGVAFVMHRKMKHVDMIEALKSVE